MNIRGSVILPVILVLAITGLGLIVSESTGLTNVLGSAEEVFVNPSNEGTSLGNITGVPADNRVIISDGTILTSEADFLFDGTNLSVATDTPGAGGGNLTVHGGIVLSGNLQGTATGTFGGLIASNTISVASSSPAGNWALVVLGNQSNTGTTTLDGDTLITNKLQVNGPVEGCTETLAAGQATYKIEWESRCRTKEIPTLTLDSAITWDVPSVSTLIDVKFHIEDFTKQPSIASGTAGVRVNLYDKKGTTTPLEGQEGWNILTLKVDASTTPPTIDMSMLYGGLPY